MLTPQFMDRFLTYFLLIAFSLPLHAQSSERPNVLLILTDDQGYGDLGYHGNELIRTPTLDHLAAESLRFANFYVSPVCAPTRASLLTGRYSLRTGVRDTYNGGAIMAGTEITLAELMAKAGYRTGIFGKWHLGDNYPSRPSDQGFEESLVHLGGGMGQPGDFTTFFRGDSSYFDPVLWRNNEPTRYAGYCTDIFAAAAAEFIRQTADRPFFCYLSFNAPHTPLQLREEDYQPYANAPVAQYYLDNGGDRRPLSDRDVEDARRVYGMVSNLDDNLGRLFATLDSLGVTDNTIVLFMTDNGPQQHRYRAGLRGQKGQVYEGGVRAPFFLRYPDRFSRDTTIETVAAHIDVVPTLASLCGLSLPADRKIDGINLLPLASGDPPVPDTVRELFLYWSRNYPVPYHNMTLIEGRHKLIGYTSHTARADDFALYDLQRDPHEQIDIAATEPALTGRLFATLDDHYRELIASPNLQSPIRIVIDTTQEHPVYLNRNDAGGQRGIWTQEEVYGKWHLDVATPGTFRLTCQFLQPVPPGGTLYLEAGARVFTTETAVATDSLVIDEVSLPAGPVDLVPFYEVAGRRIFPLFLKLEVP